MSEETGHSEHDPQSSGLRKVFDWGGQLLVVVLLGFWLLLFAGGLTVSSEVYRFVISPDGAATYAGEDVDTVAFRIKEALIYRSTDSTTGDTLGATRDTIDASPDTTVSTPDTILSPQVSDTISEDTTAPATTFPWDRAPGRLASWFWMVLFFTPTNLFLLSILAGVLGALGAIANLTGDSAEQSAKKDWTHPLLSGALRGFLVYLSVIAGLIALVENPFANLTPFSYVRLAGLFSLLSFASSYQPLLLRKLFQRLGEGMDKKTP